jgi:hypothetical protein
VTYYAFARTRFPETVSYIASCLAGPKQHLTLPISLQVVVFGPDQMGASEEEISPNYYMGNGRGLLKACRLIEFAAASTQDRGKHMGVIGYCSGGGKQKGACQYYTPEKHSGTTCPAPKYESFHGFRNVVPRNVDKAFLSWDLEFLKNHLQEVSRVKIVGEGASSSRPESVNVEEAPTSLKMTLSALDKTLSPHSQTLKKT